MGIERFKDMAFELLNDTDDVGISDINTNDKESTFKVFLLIGNCSNYIRMLKRYNIRQEQW